MPPDVEEMQTTTENDGTATHDELVEAVRAAREAGGPGTAEVEPTEGATPAPPPAETEPAEPNPDAEFETLLAKRRESHQELSGAKARAERMLRDAEEAKQRMIEEARAEAKRLVEEERRAFQNRFRTSPTEALRELGDPNDVADAVLREGTPEAKALAKAQEEARLAREEARIGKTALSELEKFKQEQAEEKRAAAMAQVRNEYLLQFATPEKTPYLHARYEPEEIFQRSVSLAHQWAQEGLEYKKDFDDKTIAEYLEHQSKKRIAALNGTPANQVPAGAPATGPGLATKVTANGTRTLAAAAGSERRTSPRPYHEMTPEEQKQALIDEVAAARRANPDATM